MKNVFITGASSGLGLALAKEYAQNGARLGLVGRKQATLEAIKASLPNPHCHCIYTLDVQDGDALREAANHFIEQVKTVHIVIASAGISAGTLTAEKADAAVFEQIFQTNVMGLMHTFSAFLPHMASQAKPTETFCLVGIASVAGIRGLPGASAYSASKAAAISYCESLRVEYHNTPIRVVTIAPGYIDTPMTQINDYPMPFLMPAHRFAYRARKAIEAERSYVVIPWQMGVVAKILRLLPNWLYDRLFARAPRKKRKNTTEDTSTPS